MTPLTRKLAEFSKILTVGILALAAVVFAVGGRPRGGRGQAAATATAMTRREEGAAVTARQNHTITTRGTPRCPAHRA
ncbi:hypothetical protein [Spirillospora sp. NPDC048819]|uniref:hypothetical protein n=1 Tax=Spirillospora sp. NPDC048819 TaxID=3155268 RepID=UPI0033C8DECF